MDRVKKHEDFVKKTPDKNVWITIKANKHVGDYVHDYAKESSEKRIHETTAALIEWLKVAKLDKTFVEITTFFFWAGVYAGIMNSDEFIVSVRDEQGKPVLVSK